MRILLAVDGSPNSNNAVAEIARRPWPEHTTIRVISVIEIPPLSLIGLPSSYFDQLIKPIRAHGEKIVKAATDILIEKFGNAVDIYGGVLNGSPKREIVEEANRWCADLIIVGSHGHDGWVSNLLGSIPQSVAVHARCSVEIVRPYHPNLN